VRDRPLLYDAGATRKRAAGARRHHRLQHVHAAAACGASFAHLSTHSGGRLRPRISCSTGRRTSRAGRMSGKPTSFSQPVPARTCGRLPDMGKEVDFVSALHRRTSRDYVGRVTEHDKAECATIAKRWGAEYWDGARQYGYGGYRYDARWRPVAERLVEHYRLAAGQRLLDVGCGKAHLLYELAQIVPGLEVVGIDISEYGLLHAKKELKGALVRGSAAALPFEQAS